MNIPMQKGSCNFNTYFVYIHILVVINSCTVYLVMMVGRIHDSRLLF